MALEKTRRDTGGPHLISARPVVLWTEVECAGQVTGYSWGDKGGLWAQGEKTGAKLRVKYPGPCG